MKKALASAVIAILLLGCCLAESISAHPTDPYRDRIENVLRMATSMRRKAIAPLDISITLKNGIGYDEPVSWSVDVTGGTAPYSFTYIIASKPVSGNIWDSEGASVDSPNDTFSYCFVVPNIYRLFVTVTDSKGVSQTVSTDAYELTADASHPSIDTITAQIAEQCRSECTGDFERAVWLHDYLTHTACYDTSYSYYGADGVLIRKTGVCDSYRKAYTKLLNKVEIEAGGVSGGGHAWTMAKLDGDWYMIDPTWDDPVTSNNEPESGSEYHLYFGLTTELLELDHIIEKYEDISAHECIAIADNYAYHTGEAKQWLEDDSWNGTSVRTQIESCLDKGGLSYSIDPTCVQLYHDGRYYDDPLIWAPVAWTVADEVWSIEGVQMPVSANYNLDTYKLDAQLDLLLMDAVRLPENVTTIEAEAFANDATVSYVVIPDGTETIGSRAFANCKALMSVEISDSVTQIAEDAFEGCPRVTILCEKNGSVESWAKAHCLEFENK